MNSWIIHNDSDFRLIITFRFMNVIYIIYNFILIFFVEFIEWFYAIVPLIQSLDIATTKLMTHESLSTDIITRLLSILQLYIHEVFIATWNSSTNTSLWPVLLNGTEDKLLQEIFLTSLVLPSYFGNLCMGMSVWVSQHFLYKIINPRPWKYIVPSQLSKCSSSLYIVIFDIVLLIMYSFVFWIWNFAILYFILLSIDCIFACDLFFFDSFIIIFHLKSVNIEYTRYCWNQFIITFIHNNILFDIWWNKINTKSIAEVGIK